MRPPHRRIRQVPFRAWCHVGGTGGAQSQTRPSSRARLDQGARLLSTCRGSRRCTEESHRDLRHVPSGCFGSRTIRRDADRRISTRAARGPLNDLLRAGLEAAPDEVAIESVYRRLTWRELEEESARWPAATGARARARRPARVADAEPGRPRRPLPRLLQGGADRDAAQLPLHRPRDRPRARGERRPGAARPRRAGRGRRRERARRRACELGTIAYRDAEPLRARTRSRPGVDAGWRHDFAALPRLRARLPPEQAGARPRRRRPRSSSPPAAPGRPRASPTPASRCAG